MCFRLVFMLQQNPPEISLKNVDFLIIDESDKLFEAGVRGFRDQVRDLKLKVFCINWYHSCYSQKVSETVLLNLFLSRVSLS